MPWQRMNSINFYGISVAKHCIQPFIVYHKTFKHTEKCKSNWICQFLQNISRFKFFVCLFHGFFTSGNYCQKHVFVSGRRDITSQSQFRYTIWLMWMLLYVEYIFVKVLTTLTKKCSEQIWILVFFSWKTYLLPRPDWKTYYNE